MTQDPLVLAVGLALLALGAIGATLTQRTLTEQGRGRRIPLAMVPFGVLIGAGAAVIRGWDLVVALVAGAAIVPAVAVGGRWLEVRRGRGRRDG